MTTDSVPAGADPRRLLSDVRALARRVRLDQRVTWFALLVLAAVTFVAIPIDRYGLVTNCPPVDHRSLCHEWHRGATIYWPPALLLAYAAIAVWSVRVARARGLGARVLPYVVTGVALVVLSAAVWLLAQQYLRSHPPLTHPLPSWVMLLDRLVGPAGTIGVALLVLAWLERHVALLVFTLVYLAAVLQPISFGPGYPPMTVPQQVLNGAVLLLGAVGFAVARRWHR
jgi:hypothetical protein